MGLLMIPRPWMSGRTLGRLYAKAGRWHDLLGARAELPSDGSRGARGAVPSWTSSPRSLPGTCSSPALPVRLRLAPCGPSVTFPGTSRTSFSPTAWPHCGSTALCRRMRVTPEGGPKEAGRCGSCPSLITNANHRESENSLRTGREAYNSTDGPSLAQTRY